jgi:hypothetical protein
MFTPFFNEFLYACPSLDMMFYKIIGNVILRICILFADFSHFSYEETLYRIFHMCFPPNFGSFGYSVSEEKII